MRRRVAHGLFVLVTGGMAAVLGIASALLYSGPGRTLLARILSDQSSRLVRGSVHVRGVGGGWMRGFTLDSVVIRDTSGVLLAQIPRLEVVYQLPEMGAGRVVFARARLERPDIQILKHRGGRANYEEIFRLNEGPAGGGPSPLVQISGIEIVDGRVTVRLPWNPDGRLRTPRQVDSALAAERARPGRRIEAGREGQEIFRTLTGVNAVFPLLVLATPDHKPVALTIEHLAARISDPALDLLDLRGSLHAKDDSLVFELDRIQLPGTEARGAGRLDWPRDTILYHFTFDASSVALADLRFVSPHFPDFTGSARLTARSLSGARTEWDIRDLAVGTAATRVSGRLVAITDAYRGLGFRGLDLALAGLDLDVVRPYLDTLPFHGTISGPLRANGFFDAMTVGFDWRFEDARVPGGAGSQVALEGLVHLGGAGGLRFEGTQLPRADLDLRTVRLVAPAVILEGRLGLAGTLDGPWKNVVFDGSAEQRDGERPASRLQGRVHLDTRGAVLGLDTDVRLDSLVFEGIRRSFPGLRADGSLGGRVRLAGTLERLAVDADVTGRLGRVEARGVATLAPPRWGADSLRLAFEGLDLAALLGPDGAPASRLNGTLLASGVIDSAVAPVGSVGVRLGAGMLRELPLDSAAFSLRAADSLVVLDTLTAFWEGARLAGGGRIGWAAPRQGHLAAHLEARDLAALDSLLLGITGQRHDSTPGDSRLRGRGRADLTLDGALGTLTIAGTAVLDSARWQGNAVRALRSRFTFAQADSALHAEITADSATMLGESFRGLAGRVGGRPDSLGWYAAGTGGPYFRLAAGGRYQSGADRRLVQVDSLGLDLLRRRWSLARPLDVRIGDSLTVLDTLQLVTADGSGSVEVAGSLPGLAGGSLSVTALGVRLQDLYGLAQSDTTGVGGTVALDAALGGTRHRPTLRGTSTLTGPVFGDFQAPLVRAAFDYRDQLLRSNLTFWRTGLPVVRVDASLPLDLAFERVAHRQLPGALAIEATGDSVDLAIAEAFTPNLRRVAGHLTLDARVEGSWERPRLAGAARLFEGGADIPALGIRYAPVSGALRFAGDSIVTDSLRVGSRTGPLLVRGAVRLPALTSPVLGLGFDASDFTLIDVDNYLRLRATAELQLAGPFLHPVLTGRGRIANSVIYFSDLVTKDIINLEDPLIADLVDTLALRRQDLLANVQSRFLDSLTIRDMDFTAGEGVWLRSNEANFQLEGRVRVNKVPRREQNASIYRLDGTFDTPRGTYTLKAGGFINRTFTVERGTVRYYGDLNAELDVQAQHLVKTPQGSGTDVPVIAHITGTLKVPKLSLATPPDRPPMSEPELISLLVLGTTDPAAVAQFGTQRPNVEFAAAFALNAFSSELQRALISGTGAPLDIVEIRPGLATSGFIGGTTSTPTQLAVGKAITSKLFLTGNAGFCFIGGNVLSARNFGASLEYRFVRELRAVISAEPIQTCNLQGVGAFFVQKLYQFGAELRWDRDY